MPPRVVTNAPTKRASLPEPARNSKRQVRQRKLRDDPNLRALSLGKSQRPPANHLWQAPRQSRAKAHRRKAWIPSIHSPLPLRLGGFARAPLVPLVNHLAKKWLGLCSTGLRFGLLRRGRNAAVAGRLTEHHILIWLGGARVKVNPGEHNRKSDSATASMPRSLSNFSVTRVLAKLNFRMLGRVIRIPTLQIDRQFRRA